MTRLSLLLAALLSLAVAGCAAQPQDNASTDTPDDAYQFGDVTFGALDRLIERQNDYCATASPARRAILLALIRSQVPVYPASGLCTSAERVLFDELARQSLKMPDVDIEQAREDRQKAQERLDEGQARERHTSQ